MGVLECDNSRAAGEDCDLWDILCVTKHVLSKAHPQQFIWVISLIDSCLQTLWGGLKKTNNVQKSVCVCVCVCVRVRVCMRVCVCVCVDLDQ